VTPAETPRRLGRGLGALLAPMAAGEPRAGAPAEGAVQRIPIAHIRPNPYQPRKEFRAEELAELVSSLKAAGLLQPIAVRVAGVGTADKGRAQQYELLVGERRLRAATELGWEDIPAVVRQVDDRTALTVALVENLQRTDLNPIEEAEGYARLIEEFSLTQQQVSDAVGKDRSTVGNMLRLLKLPGAVRIMLRDAQLTLGHARALLALSSEREMIAAAQDVVARGLTVRDVEGLKAPKQATVKRHHRATKASRLLDVQGKRIEEKLRRFLQTDVRLTLTARDRGHLSILFYSNDDLERVLELILGRSGDGL
jgi:ParB family transcriptional regulator, chromosome partitioning protein